KLARALNVDIKRIKTKRSLLDGVCPEVAEMLKDKSIDTDVFTLLRKMKPMRQIEAVELMLAMNNHSARYAHALLAATRREDLVQPKKIHGLSAEQIARMEHEMDGLQREFKAVSASYGDTVLNLVVASGYLPASSAMPGSAAIWNATTLKSSVNSAPLSQPHRWRKAGRGYRKSRLSWIEATR